ncbi:MAG: homoserine dehydrogenase [Desulfuromonas thiophila]|jgi:homoserine dehydrogenase|nr:homoserine dehydrogenase [Desulfuromonas thiophila]
METLKAGLLGFGTIGTGVAKVFHTNADLMRQRLGMALELVAIADLDVTTDRGVATTARLTTDAQSILNDPQIDVVIELIGGYEPARTFVLTALNNGKHVVTANKALLALYGEELFKAAEENGVRLLFEAAVAGGIPVLSAIRENLGANRFSGVFGILNGTCNYILTRMTEENEDFALVLQDAQRLGYAEADPTFDIEGIDTAHKLAILISMCFGTWIDFNRIYTEGITRISALDIQFARQFGYQIKLLAIGKCEDGVIEARVHPTMIPQHYPLADVRGVFNGVRLMGDFVGPVMLIGRGAGMEATASAVMGDVMSLARQGRAAALGYPPLSMARLPVRPMDEVVSQYYLRFLVKDVPGVLAQISGVLGDCGISISSMIQSERKVGGFVPIVMVTHDACERNIRQALERIDVLPVVEGQSLLIRMENSLT